MADSFAAAAPRCRNSRRNKGRPRRRGRDADEGCPRRPGCDAEQKKDYTFFRFNVDGVTPFLPLSDPANPLNGRTGRFKGSHTDYRVNVDYQWTDDVMTYVQFATGFKGGGISPRPYFPQQVRGFGPEELEAYELGMKSRWFDRRLQANVAIFYNDYLGYQSAPSNAKSDSSQASPCLSQAKLGLNRLAFRTRISARAG